jgi:hypothetical protein
MGLVLDTTGAPATAAELFPAEGVGPLSPCCIQGWFFRSDSLARLAGSGMRIFERRSLAVEGEECQTEKWRERDRMEKRTLGGEPVRILEVGILDLLEQSGHGVLVER